MTAPHPRGRSGLMLLAGLLLLLAACGSAPPGTGAPPPSLPKNAQVPWPSDLPAADPIRCPATEVEVSTSAELRTALRTAVPGAVIGLADGVYEGLFTATGAGTAAAPITLCGSTGAVIDGGGIKRGYGLHLNSASYWRVTGFTVRNGQKGVMGDGVNHSVISGLTVEQTGDEAIHLRKFSSDNVVENNTVRNTGNRKPKFGEGVYIGTANSNWAEITGCEPDASDRNVVRGNRISGTTAESVDIKEGTTGGIVAGNTFDGCRHCRRRRLLGRRQGQRLADRRQHRHQRRRTASRPTGPSTAGAPATSSTRQHRRRATAPATASASPPPSATGSTCDNKVDGRRRGPANIACG